MRSMCNVKLPIFKPDIGVTVLALLYRSLLPGQKVLEVSYGGEIEKLFKGEIEVQPFLDPQSGLIAAVHVFRLFEVVSNVCPKLIIFVVGHLRLDE